MKESFKGNVSKQSLGVLKEIEGHAKGGIFSTPHIAQFAEEGPEAVIPLNNSKQAREIWIQSGQLLGIFRENTQLTEEASGVGYFLQDSEKEVQNMSKDSYGFLSMESRKGNQIDSLLLRKSRAEEALSSLQETDLGNQSYQIFYNPIFQIQSDSSGLEEKIKETIQLSEDEFEAYFSRFLRNQKRFSLGEVSM